MRGVSVGVRGGGAVALLVCAGSTMGVGMRRVLDVPRCAWRVLVYGVSGLPGPRCCQLRITLPGPQARTPFFRISTYRGHGIRPGSPVPCFLSSGQDKQPASSTFSPLPHPVFCPWHCRGSFRPSPCLRSRSVATPLSRSKVVVRESKSKNQSLYFLPRIQPGQRTQRLMGRK